MCTVSLIRPLVPGAVRLRVVVNRDERRSRPAALAPIVVRTAGPRAVMPIDPVGMGSWIAVNDAGIVLALLNGSDPVLAGEAATGGPSRGRIIPALVGSRCLRDVIKGLQSMRLDHFRPWRLVAATTTDLLDVRSDTVRDRLALTPLPPVFVATSSSVRAQEAAALRTRLFRDMVATPDAAAQDRYHSHQWHDRRDLSVRMERSDARTVSRTIVELGARKVRLRYTALA